MKPSKLFCDRKESISVKENFSFGDKWISVFLHFIRYFLSISCLLRLRMKTCLIVCVRSVSFSASEHVSIFHMDFFLIAMTGGLPIETSVTVACTRISHVHVDSKTLALALTQRHRLYQPNYAWIVCSFSTTFVLCLLLSMISSKTHRKTQKKTILNFVAIFSSSLVHSQDDSV